VTDLVVYLDGACHPSALATIPVNSAGVKYGANVFEGICLYTNPDGTRYLFRLPEHIDWLEAL
jgi:branched-subunit amino acid aminotransferase/4-amino-4-deoxychorismate lyase